MKKTTKRKMYHKRRKKEKADQRRNKIQPEMSQTKVPPKPATYKYNINKQFQRNQYEHFCTYNNNRQHEFIKLSNSYTQGLQLWWQTYCHAIQYHAQQQKRWNNENSNLQMPTNNDENMTLLEKYAREYETSSEEEDEDEQQKEEETYFLSHSSHFDKIMDSKTDEVDDAYIKFLEITNKHKEELRIKRAEENLI